MQDTNRPQINAEEDGALSIYSRGGERGAAIEDQGKEVFDYLSLLLIHYYQFSSNVYQGVTPSDLPFLVNARVKALPVILCIPCKVQFQLCLALPRPPLSPIFNCLYICSFPFSLTIRPLLTRLLCYFSKRCQGG